MTDQPLSWTPPMPGDPAAAPAMTRTGVARLEMIDLLRGLAVVLMVLDHVREYFSLQALQFEPTDLSQTHATLFALRWITHLCAPTFVFLSGVSVFLQRQSGAARGDVARFLLTRGLWLILLEVSLISFAFNFAHPYLFLQVIWAIGFGMVAMAALIWLPPPVVLAVGVVIVGAHGLLDGVQASQLGALAPLWRLMMQPGPLGWAPGIVVYPAIPWFGVMCLGYGLGVVFQLPERPRRLILLAIGLAALGLFVALRMMNGYGDPAPWAAQKSGVFTALSFLKVSKYPPSLDFVAVTLGLALLIGLWLEGLKGFTPRLLLTFGRTPLFTYLLHIFLIHGLALLVGLSQGLPAGLFTHFIEGTKGLAGAHWGFHTGTVLLIWLAVVLALYPMSRAYMRLKQTRRAAWMSYL